MKVKDLTCYIDNVLYYNLDTGDVFDLSTFNEATYAEYYIQQISADFINDLYVVLVDISEFESAQDE